jgi:putative hemolysin
MEDGRDARICRDRLLAELERTDDVQIRQSLWRAAKRYAARARDEAAEVQRFALAGW